MKYFFKDKEDLDALYELFALKKQVREARLHEGLNKQCFHFERAF